MSKKSKNSGKWIVYLIAVAIGIVLGVSLSKTRGNSSADTFEDLSGLMIKLLMCLAFFYIALILHVIIHESGHLLFGLISGYKFGSFRIFSFMWVKSNGKLRCRLYSLKGTAGQCLMIPPETSDGNFPVTLYNFGGVILNVVFSVAAIGICFLVGGKSFGGICAIIFALGGIFLALTNGIPMRLNMIGNDGYNAFALRKNAEARRSFRIQLDMQAELADGKRLQDMPDEWFTLPSDEAMKNSMTAVMGAFVCNRLMDEHRFAEANAVMIRLLNSENGMIDLYRKMMMCDRIYCELMLGNFSQAAAIHSSVEQAKFMKLMKNNISVLRTEYAYGLYRKNVNAEKHKKRFEKGAKKYPYQGEIQSERELMSLAEEKFCVKEAETNM